MHHGVSVAGRAGGAALSAVALGFALGFCAAFIAALALRLHRDDAACAEWRANWEAECARHDATLAQLHQLQAQSDVAAVKVVHLSHALLDATAQVQEGRAGVHVVAPQTAAAMRFWVN